MSSADRLVVALVNVRQLRRQLKIPSTQKARTADSFLPGDLQMVDRVSPPTLHTCDPGRHTVEAKRGSEEAAGHQAGLEACGRPTLALQRVQDRAHGRAPSDPAPGPPDPPHDQRHPARLAHGLCGLREEHHQHRPLRRHQAPAGHRQDGYPGPTRALAD